MRRLLTVAAVALALMASATAHAQTKTVNSLFDLLCGYYGICSNSGIADSDVTIGTSVVQVGRNNPARVELVLTNNSSNQMWCSNSDLVASNAGVQVPSNSSLIINWQTDFDSTGAPWFCIASAASSAMHIHAIDLH